MRYHRFQKKKEMGCKIGSPPENYHTWKKSGLNSRTLSKSGKADFERPMASNTVALLKYVRKLSGSPSEINREKMSNTLVI